MNLARSEVALCYISDMPDRSLYETVLAAGRGGERPLIRPRNSAAVVLWRHLRGELQVYWVRRSPELRFMGGFYAFPGGKVSRNDSRIEPAGDLRTLGGSSRGARKGALPAGVLDGLVELGPPVTGAVVAAALRELFEETGLLLAQGCEGAEIPAGEALAAMRRRLLDGELDFAGWLADSGLQLDAARLTFAGRWVTPPLGPVRFDNRFFLAEWRPDSDEEPSIHPGELVEGEWIAPRRALDRWREQGILTAPPILHLMDVLAEDGARAGLDRLRAPHEANLGAYRRVEFRPGVLVLPTATATLPPATHTNVYVIGTGDAVLVDPGDGSGDGCERLRGAVDAVAARLGRRVRAIWLTHHHPDHAGGAAALREALGVPLLAHSATAHRLADAGVETDGLLEDGQRIVLDGDPPVDIDVVHTPGHAPGHLAFMCRKGGWALAGDLIAGFGTIVVDPPDGDMGEYLASLERLRDLDPGTLFPAHGPAQIDGRRSLDRYLRHRRRREQSVLAAWDEGLREPAEIVPVVYDDLAEAAVPLAERQVLAHLQHLERQGLLGR